MNATPVLPALSLLSVYRTGGIPDTASLLRFFQRIVKHFSSLVYFFSPHVQWRTKTDRPLATLERYQPVLDEGGEERISAACVK